MFHLIFTRITFDTSLCCVSINLRRPVALRSRTPSEHSCRAVCKYVHRTTVIDKLDKVLMYYIAMQPKVGKNELGQSVHF